MPRTSSKSSTKHTTCSATPNKRAQYDRFGTIPGAAGGWLGGSGYVDFDDLFGGGFGVGDIFSSFFGGARRWRCPSAAHARAAIWASACV